MMDAAPPAHRDRLALLLLTVTVAAVFGNTLLNGFVWDDNSLIVGNPAYVHFDTRRIFTTLANGLEYLPVRDLSYAADYLLWGEKPSGFHFSNLFYYWLTVVAAFYLARATSLHLRRNGTEDTSFRTGLATALLFAVHPIHSEVVSFITCRNAIISTLLFFCSCRLYLGFCRASSHGGLRLAGAMLCYLASLLAKVTGIILPLVLACYPLFPGFRKRRRLFLAILPFAVVAAGAFSFFRKIAESAHVISPMQGLANLGGWQMTVLKPVRIAAFYVGKLVVPFGFASEYNPLPFYAPPAGRDYAVLLAFVLSAVAAFMARKRFPPLLFGYAWFAITLIPVLNFFPTSPVIADRYAFLPSFGFVFILASLLNELTGKKLRLLAAGAVILLVTFWGVLAFRANRAWYSEQTLWENAVRVNPGAVNAYTNLGRRYFDANRYDERAFACFARAQENDCGDPHLDYFTGLSFYLDGNFPAAIVHFNRALGRSMEFMEALYHLGLIYEQTGEPGKAVEYYWLVTTSRQMDTGESMKEKAAERLRVLAGK